MNKDLISSIWDQRKIIAEISTTAFVICKGLVDFARKNGTSKVFAIAELGLGIGAAAIHTGAADKIVSAIAERKAKEDYRRYPPEECDPYGDLDPGPDPYDEYDDYDEDEDYDPEDDAAYEESPEEEGVDEDGFNTSEFDEFINSEVEEKIPEE